MAEPVDPYAAIRRLQFYQSAPAWAGGVQERGDGSEYVAPMAAQWGLGTGPEDTSAYDAFRASGFESKYGTPTVSADGNTMTLELQAPAAEGLGHKYNTMTAQYTRGADGQWTLSNDPRQQLNRQVSSGERWRDTVEGFWPVLAVAGAGYAGGAYGGEAAGGGGLIGGGAGEAAGAGVGAESGLIGGAAAGGGAVGGAGAATGAGQAVGGAAGEAMGGTTGGSTGGTSGWGALQDWMRQNPAAGRAIAGLIGAGLTQTGGSSDGGGYQDSGYRPTISRGGWQASVTPRASAPAAQPLGQSPSLLSAGMANDGLWRYRGLLGGGK